MKNIVTGAMTNSLYLEQEEINWAVTKPLALKLTSNFPRSSYPAIKMLIWESEGRGWGMSDITLSLPGSKGVA